MIVNQLWHGGVRALLDYDPTIFDDLLVPPNISAERVIDRILFKYGDTPLFCPDPAIFKFYIERWSARKLNSWIRYYNAIHERYDPLENYDRYELETITYGKNIANTGTVTDETSGRIIDTPEGTVKVENDTTTENKISADNSGVYLPDNESIVDGETNTSYNDYTETREFDDYEQERTLDTNEAHSGEDVRDVHIHGNIGVTTSQQMLNQELDLMARLDLVEFIADEWRKEFCLDMYI